MPSLSGLIGWLIACHWWCARRLKESSSSAAAKGKSWVAQRTTQLVRWVVHTNFGWPDIKYWKKYAYFDNHTSSMAASSGTLGQKKSLGCQSDQYLVISGSPDRFIGRIWRPLSYSTGLGRLRFDWIMRWFWFLNHFSPDKAKKRLSIQHENTRGKLMIYSFLSQHYSVKRLHWRLSCVQARVNVQDSSQLWPVSQQHRLEWRRS